MKRTQKKHLLSFLALTVLCGSTSCQKKHKSDPEESIRSPNAELLLADPVVKDRWILKASRKLRHGIEPDSVQMAAWQKLAPQEVVAQMLETPEAKDGGLDFILYFLGFKDDHWIFPTGKPLDSSLAFDITRSHSMTSISVAMEAALKLSKNEDFLTSLAQLKGRYFPAPLPWGKTRIFSKDVDLEMQVKNFFQRIYKQQAMIHEMVQTKMVPPEFCTLTKFGDTPDYVSALIDASLLNIIYLPQLELGFMMCQRPGYSGPADATAPENVDIPVPIPESFPRIMKDFDKLAEIARKLEQDFLHDRYAPHSLSDLKSLTFDGNVFHPSSEQLSREWFWTRERNSSTNRNRKRAAYILNRFFCDDLTPIGVEVPANHSDNRHASDPGCVSCHYKLDPMAGFFRKVGRLGREQTVDESRFTFDDFASTPTKEYFESWKGEDGSYDIGYIRSRTDKSLNAYPAHRDDPEFSDLVEILKTAPEVKRCVVKRAFQYLAGEEMALDRGYQNELEAVYNADPARTSSLSLKEVMKAITLSYSFIRDTSERGVCYDFPKNYDPAGKPACEINFIVEQNCAASCHSKSGAAGNLDMSGWVTPTAANAPGGFIHLKSDGTPYSYSESLTRIAERLNTTDSSERMPLSKDMNPVDRETLYLWTQAQLRSFK